MLAAALVAAAGACSGGVCAPGGGAVVSQVSPVHPARGFYCHDGHRASLRNVAFVNGSLTFYGLDEAGQKLARGLAPFKHMTARGHVYTPLTLEFEEAAGQSWCPPGGTLVREEAHLLPLWHDTNAFHLLADNLLPLFYSAFHAHPLAAETPLRRPRAPGAVDPDPHPNVRAIMASPRVAYTFRDVYGPQHLESVARHRLSLYGLLWGMVGPEEDLRSYDELVRPGAAPTCFERLQWQPTVRTMSQFYDTWSPHAEGVLYAMAKWALARHGVSLPREEPDPLRPPRFTFAARPCGLPERCVAPASRERLAAVLRERHGAETVVWEGWADARASLELVARRTDVLVGLHGAGLANGAFLRPGSVVAELKTRKGIRSVLFRHVSYHVGSYYFEWDVWGHGEREPRPEHGWAAGAGGLEPTREQLEQLADSLVAFWHDRHRRKARFAALYRRPDVRLWPHCTTPQTEECAPPAAGPVAASRREMEERRRESVKG